MFLAISFMKFPSDRTAPPFPYIKVSFCFVCCILVFVCIYEGFNSASASCVVSLVEMVLSNKGCLFGSAFSSLPIFSSKGN